MRGELGPADDGTLPWGAEGPGWPADPYRAYRLARGGGPVRPGRLRNGRPVWLVLGCAEARAALADPRLSTDGRRFLRRYWSQAGGSGDPRPDEMSLAEHMLSADPPDRTRLRRLVSQAFTLRRVEAMRPRVAAFEVAGYLAEPLAAKRAAPANDVVSGLAAARDPGQALTEPELMSTVFLLLLAGHETTVNLIGNGVAALLGDPGLLARVRADPSVVEPAVEELLRFDAPVHHPTLRFAMEPVPWAT